MTTDDEFARAIAPSTPEEEEGQPMTPEAAAEAMDRWRAREAELAAIKAEQKEEDDLT